MGTSNALHRLKNNCGNIIADHFFRCVAIVAWNEIHVEGKPRKAIPAIAVPSDRGGSGSATVEALRDRKHLFSACGYKRHAQCILIGLGTRVHEECPMQIVRRNRDQLFRGLGTNIERDGIALKQQVFALSLYGFDQSRVSVTECRDSVTAVQIENASATGRDDVAASGAYGNGRWP